MFDQALINKLMCVALVTAVMMPAGALLFPYISADITGPQFHAVEAVLSTTLGFGIFALLG
jgi:hypothetical protein